jgi:uncharacterized membrane protein
MAASKLGLDKNTAAALSYVLGPVTGVVFFLLEKDPFVRFHAMQSIIVFGALFILQWIMGITIILIWLLPLMTIFTFILWLILIYKAWQGDQWEVPVLGQYAKKALERVNK